MAPEALLSGFLNVVFERLLSPQGVHLIKGKKLDPDLVERLNTALGSARDLLVDGERKQFDNAYVKEWLDSLTDAVYKADDLLDRVFTFIKAEAATQKKVRASLTVNKIEEAVRTIEISLKIGDILGLKEVARDNNYLSWRTPTTFLVKGNIYGREDDQEAIIKIINDVSDHQKEKLSLSVIPIVGMGGVGKTTLAQWVYNSEDLMKGFDFKAWVCISEVFDVVKVTKTIIEEITHSTCNLEDLNLLQLDLKEKLSARKFFIVLDDVWSDEYDIWSNFKTPFHFGSEGSTVLITTRSKDVASVVGTCAPYFLKPLSDDYCWSVFADNACFSESNGNSAFEDIGRMIVMKCNGLPLAAETLGCLLRTKRDIHEWSAVLMSNNWHFDFGDSKIYRMLLMSYFYLPAHLKSCFVYCSLFPKGHRFVREDLILLWMAEDLLPQPKGGQTLEEVGNECFDNLVSRSFFEHHSDWFSSEYFLMHDLLHDLAMYIAGDFYCRLEELGKAERMSIKTRHLSYGSLSNPISKNFDSIDKVEYLRTFLQVNFWRPSFSVERAPHIILSKLKYLRVLSFCSFEGLYLLPDSIGKLIHLRYLDLSDTSIRTLPESLCGLYNLQTLKLRGCSRLTMLPKGMHNLLNLRHLDLRETSLQEMPTGMGKLKHLHVLGFFEGDVSYSDGVLELTNLERLANRDKAMGPRMMNETDVEKLILKWSSDDDIIVSVSDMLTGSGIFGKLQPHYGLKELKFRGYRGMRFPNWVGYSSYHNMTRVSLDSCRNCPRLPSLGQLPSLKSLKIKYFDTLWTIGAEFYKNEDDPSSSSSSPPFSSLEDLTFRGMPLLEKWISFDQDIHNAFPQLKRLSIVDCPNLKGDLPNHLPALETLEIEKCHQLIVSSLPSAPAIRILEISESDKVGLQELPLSLGSLSIRGCQQVESMFRAMSANHPTRLESITISDCLSATSLPWDCLPESLRRLRIENCRKLESPSQQLQKHKLVELELDHSCDSLTLLQLEAFPELKDLTVRGCENLESFSFSESQPQHDALHSLKISDCPKLVSFPKEGLAAPNMTSFWVIGCKELKSLPRHMNTLLPNLNNLVISDCPDIDSFPEGGLPPRLKELQVKNCEKLLSNLSSMGVHEALTDLYICGSDCKSIKSFPGLPSLTTMCLRGFSNMETLECKELLRFTSLRNLYINACPKLDKIAGDRLPDSLLLLAIYECPLLAQHCKNKHKQIWPKISHVRGIQVDYRFVS